MSAFLNIVNNKKNMLSIDSGLLLCESFMEYGSVLSVERDFCWQGKSLSLTLDKLHTYVS